MISILVHVFSPTISMILIDCIVAIVENCMESLRHSYCIVGWGTGIMENFAKFNQKLTLESGLGLLEAHWQDESDDTKTSQNYI